MAMVPIGGGAFLKASDIQRGDTATIKTEADWVEGTYNGQPTRQFICEVTYKGEDRRLKLTQASCDELRPVFGGDSKDWIGKQISLEPIAVLVGGQKKQSILATPVGVEVAKETPVDWDE